MAGRQGLEIEVRTPEGTVHDESGIYPVDDGRLALMIRPAFRDPAGKWSVRCTEIASGKKTEITFDVQ